MGPLIKKNKVAKRYIHKSCLQVKKKNRMRDVCQLYLCKTQLQTYTAKAIAKAHEKMDVWTGCLPVN